MSGYEIALNGLMTHTKAFNRHAENVLQGTTVTGFADPSRAPADLLTLGGETSTVEDNLIGMMTARHGYTASAKLIGAQRDMDQELLDILS